MPDQVYTREEFARLQMEVVKRSGFSEHNSGAMREERQFEQELAAARAADNYAVREDEKEIVTRMLNLMDAVAKIRQHSGRGAPNDRDYDSSRRQVEALVDIASFKGPQVGSWIIGKLPYLANPVTKGATDVANMTGSPILKKIVANFNEAYGFASSGVGAVGVFWRPLPDVVDALAHPVSHFVGHAVGPLFNLVGRGITVITILKKNSNLDPLLAFWLRYENTCNCCGPIKQVTDAWMKGIATTVMMGHPFYAVFLGCRKYWKKKKNRALPAPNTVIAGKLWDAANNFSTCDHQFTRPFAVTTGYGHHCPFALLALATLFGKGDAGKGYQWAVAALMSDRSSGTAKIAKLVS